MSGKFTSRSIVQGGLIAGGPTDRRGRRACFFIAMHPLDNSLPAANDIPTGAPKMVPYYKHTYKPEFDAVFAFDLQIAHQTGSFACFCITPCRRSIGKSGSGQQREVLFDKRSTQVTEITRACNSIGKEEDPVQPSMTMFAGSFSWVRFAFFFALCLLRFPTVFMFLAFPMLLKFWLEWCCVPFTTPFFRWMDKYLW